MSRTLQAAFGFSAGVLLLVSCDSPPPTGPTALSDAPLAGASSAAAIGAHAGHQHSGVTAADNADVHRGIAEVRRFLAPFHNFDKAVEYGYSAAAPGPGVCSFDPIRGGMATTTRGQTAI